MKRLFVFGITLLLTINISYAKKVKFSVDMTGYTVSSNGVYIVGDFQLAAGYTSDWDNTATSLTQEGSTSIYSVVVDIPANAKYEYKFINGSLWYNVEFVPLESRVSEDNDSRWTYISSSGSDTTFVGPILYSGNTSNGKYLVRVLVDMKNQTVNTNGVFAQAISESGSFDSSNFTALYPLNDKVYEGFLYLAAGSYEYKFFNGYNTANAESVPSGCAITNGNRSLTVSDNVVLDTVCFSECSSCGSTAAVKTATYNSNISLNPTVISESAILSIASGTTPYSVVIKDLSGKSVRSYNNIQEGDLTIKKDDLKTGAYLLSVGTNNKLIRTLKFIVK